MNDEVIKQYVLLIPVFKEELALSNEEIEVWKLKEQNKGMDELFNLAKDKVSVTSEISKLSL